MFIFLLKVLTHHAVKSSLMPVWFCAGFALVSIFNILMILSLGFVDEEACNRVTVHQHHQQQHPSAYSNYTAPTNGRA